MIAPDSSTADSGGPTVPPDPPGPTQVGRVTIEVEARPGITTIVVKGELDLVTMPFLAAQLALAARDRPDRLVFDLAQTHFMDCGSARLIAGAGQLAARRPAGHPPSAARRAPDPRADWSGRPVGDRKVSRG